MLLATIPARRAACERLLAELPLQRRVPDGVILCLDGYGDAPAPACPLPVVATYRTAQLSGPGARWRAAADLPPEDLLIALDDDAVPGEAFLEELAGMAERTGGAAAAMGYTPSGHRAAPGPLLGAGRVARAIKYLSDRRLLLGCGCGLAVRAGHLAGLQALAAEVRAAGGPDALGPCGDDQALVSAHLWRRGVPLYHAATGPLHFADGTQAASETRARQARGERTLFEQARAIARLTGWPLAEPVVEVQAVAPLSWEAELSAVPAGAARARGAAPPPGCRRVLVVDEAEPERSGVYDAPVKAQAPRTIVRTARHSWEADLMKRSILRAAPEAHVAVQSNGAAPPDERLVFKITLPDGVSTEEIDRAISQALLLASGAPSTTHGRRQLP